MTLKKGDKLYCIRSYDPSHGAYSVVTQGKTYVVHDVMRGNPLFINDCGEVDEFLPEYTWDYFSVAPRVRRNLPAWW